MRQNRSGELLHGAPALGGLPWLLFEEAGRLFFVTRFFRGDKNRQASPVVAAHQLARKLFRASAALARGL